MVVEVLGDGLAEPTPMRTLLSALFALPRAVVMPEPFVCLVDADVIAAQVLHAYLHLSYLKRGPLPRRARTCRGLLGAGTRGVSGCRGLQAAAEALRYHSCEATGTEARYETWSGEPGTEVAYYVVAGSLASAPR